MKEFNVENQKNNCIEEECVKTPTKKDYISIMCDRNLTLSDKGVFSYLCSVSDTSKLTKKRMCSDLNISRGTLNKCLKHLENFDYITVEKNS